MLYRNPLGPGNVLLDLLHPVMLTGHLYQNTAQSQKSGQGQDHRSTGFQFKSKTKN